MKNIYLLVVDLVILIAVIVTWLNPVECFKDNELVQSTEKDIHISTSTPGELPEFISDSDMEVLVRLGIIK